MGDSVSTVERKTSHAHGMQALAADDVIPQEESKAKTKEPDIDSFHSSQASSKQNDPAHDGKFSVIQCGKNFLSGLISPIKAMIEHPLYTLGMTLGTIGLGFLVGATIMQGIGVGFFLFGGAYATWQLGKGVANFAICAANGDKDGMENSFSDFGAGVGGVAMTLFGVRGTAAVVAEAKAAGSALRTGKWIYDAANDGMNAANEVKHMSLLGAFRECFSFFKRDTLYGFSKSFSLTKAKAQALKSTEATKLININEQKVRIEGIKSRLLKVLSERDVKDLSCCFEMPEETIVQLLASIPEKELRIIAREMQIARGYTRKDILNMANKFYQHELERIANKLGVPLDRLKRLAPPIEVDDKFFALAGVGPTQNGICYKLNTKSIRFCSVANRIARLQGGIDENIPLCCGSIDDQIHHLGAHEPVHVEQDISLLLHLTRREYIRHFGKISVSKGGLLTKQIRKFVNEKIVSKVVSPIRNFIFGDRKYEFKIDFGKSPKQKSQSRFQNFLADLEGRLLGFWSYCFTDNKFVRTLRVVTTPKDKQRVHLLMESWANYKNKTAMSIGGRQRFDPYWDNFIELEPRTNSILDRTRTLSEQIHSGVLDLATSKGKLRALARELNTESRKFYGPPTAELKEQLKESRKIVRAMYLKVRKAEAA